MDNKYILDWSIINLLEFYFSSIIITAKVLIYVLFFVVFRPLAKHIVQLTECSLQVKRRKDAYKIALYSAQSQSW